MYHMLEREKIDEIAKEVAAAELGVANVARVQSEPMSDSEGQDVLRIIIIIPEEAVNRVSGDAALDTLVGLQKSLREAGEERFPIVEYATQKELDAVDGS